MISQFLNYISVMFLIASVVAVFVSKFPAAGVLIIAAIICALLGKFLGKRGV